MSLLDDRRVEMQRGKHDQVARPLFEDLIEVPHFEMPAHADQQRALADPAPRPHPRCDPQLPLAVHLRRRDEPEPTSQQRIARPPLPVRTNRAFRERSMLLGDAVAIVDEHARILRMQPDEQFVAHGSRLDRNTEMIGECQLAARADRRNRTAYKQVFHRATPSSTPWQRAVSAPHSLTEYGPKCLPTWSFMAR